MITHKRLALAWLLLVCLLAGHNAYLWLGKRIVPDSDILALLPVQERDPVLQRSFNHMVDAAQQRVIVLVGAPDWDDARRAADAYQSVLASQGQVLAADALDEAAQSNWLAPFQEHALVLLTPQQREQLQSAPASFWAEASLARLYNAFSGPKLGAFRDDPFGLFGGWVQERAQETPVRPRDGRLFVEGNDRQYVVLPMRLEAPAFSMSAQQAVIPLLERAASAARAAVPQAEVLSAGVVLHAAAAATQARSEMQTIGLGSLIGIVLLTWLTFRSLKPIGLTLLAIGVGFLGSFSVCWLLFGRIHLLTLVFGASLVGVAQDYGIYFLCNRLGADRSLDSVRLLKRLLPGLALTLLAAVIGYLGLALTPFPGLRHMAVFSALGLVFAWLTVVCWFPRLIEAGSLKPGWLTQRYGATLGRWPRLSMNPASLAVLAATAAVAALGWSRLSIDDDIRSLQAAPAHLVRDQLKLGKLLDAPTPVQYFLVRGSSEEQVLQREEQLKRRLDPFIADKHISGYQAISNWVPSARAQAQARALVETKLLAGGGPLDDLAGAVGEDAAWAETMRQHLRKAAGTMRVDAFMGSPASEPWRHLWLGNVGGGYASIVALRGMEYRALPLLPGAADGIDGVQWVDKVSEISSVLGRYRAHMGWVVLAAYAVVGALLFPRYRARAWRVVAPTALASVVTLGLLGLAGHSLQLFHILALMLLLGVGVDYGIFMQEKPEHGTTAPWLAVGLSAASTILAFGLLGLSKTPALQAFGLTMLIGTTLVWLTAPCFATRKESTHAAPVLV